MPDLVPLAFSAGASVADILGLVVRVDEGGVCVWVVEVAKGMRKHVLGICSRPKWSFCVVGKKMEKRMDEFKGLYAFRGCQNKLACNHQGSRMRHHSLVFERIYCCAPSQLLLLSMDHDVRQCLPLTAEIFGHSTTLDGQFSHHWATILDCVWDVDNLPVPVLQD